MELRFRISAEQCQALADRITANRIARLESRQAAERIRIEAFLLRWLPLGFLVVPLVIPVWGPLAGPPGHLFSIEYLLVSLFYVVFWWFCRAALTRFTVRLGLRFRSKVELAIAPFVARIIRRSVRRSVARLEGLHRWELSPAALSVQGPTGKAAVIPWQKVARLHDLGDFYQLFTRTSSRFGLAYYLAKSSAEMDAGAYGDALRQLGERVPEQTAAA